MDTLTLRDVSRLVGSTTPLSKRAPKVSGVCTDSRRVRPGDLFVCLEGERFDGHRFAAQAVADGAAAVLATRPLPELPHCLVVDDTIAALAALGRAQVERSEALVVGITGTNGKTGTKDLTVAALGAALRTVGSPHSYNNQLGVPLTLLSAERDTQAVVAEIGTSAVGEIAQLTALARPEIGVITNIHPGHLEGLGSLAGVRAEKGSLLTGLVGRQVSVLNRDDGAWPSLVDLAPGEVVSFGTHAEADLRASDVQLSCDGTRFVVTGEHPVRLAHLGRHAVLNSLAALAVAQVVGVPLTDAIGALAEVPPPPGRLQFRRQGGLTILDDSYNANPGSVAAAAALVGALRHEGRRVFVVGDMLELGASAGELHRSAGRSLAQAFPDVLVAVGRYAGAVVEGAVEVGLSRGQCHACSDRERAAEVLGAELRAGDMVLLKASRKMALETLLPELTVGASEAVADS